MNILGFNPGHHSSVCLLQDGEIKYFIQEERLTRRKYDSVPFKSFISILQNYKIDRIASASPSIHYSVDNTVNKKDQGTERAINYFHYLVEKYSPEVLFRDYHESHHKAHCAHAFYNSGFNKAIGIVIDGMGSNYNNFWGRETESIFECSYPGNFEILYKNFWQENLKGDIINQNMFTTSKINLSKVYETITMHLGWSRNEAGKTMGLAPYGKLNPTFPLLFNKNSGNSNIFYFNSDEERSNNYTETFVNESLNPQLKLKKDPKEWHHNESKITDLEKDLAWRVQNDTQQIVGDYIEKAIKKTGLNVII